MEKNYELLLECCKKNPWLRQQLLFDYFLKQSFAQTRIERLRSSVAEQLLFMGCVIDALQAQITKQVSILFNDFPCWRFYVPEHPANCRVFASISLTQEILTNWGPDFERKYLSRFSDYEFVPRVNAIDSEENREACKFIYGKADVGKIDFTAIWSDKLPEFEQIFGNAFRAVDWIVEQLAALDAFPKNPDVKRFPYGMVLYLCLKTLSGGFFERSIRTNRGAVYDELHNWTALGAKIPDFYRIIISCLSDGEFRALKDNLGEYLGWIGQKQKLLKQKYPKIWAESNPLYLRPLLSFYPD